MGAHKQQPIVGPILPPDMPANGASLAGIIRIHPNRHATRQTGFVRGLGLHIRNPPTAHLAVDLAPFHRSLLRVPTLGSIADILQPLQTHHRAWLRDGLTHTVRGIRVQPPFSQRQLPQNRLGSASALRLQRTACTGGTFSKMLLVSAMIKTTFASCIGFHRDIPAVQIHAFDGGDTVHRFGVQRLFDGNQQIPHFGCRVLPELGGTQGNPPCPPYVPASPDAGPILRTGTGCGPAKYRR